MPVNVLFGENVQSEKKIKYLFGEKNKYEKNFKKVLTFLKNSV